MKTHEAVDLFRLLGLLLCTIALPTVRTQAGCRSAFISGGVQVVLCRQWNREYHVCEDSGWGDEEATVVCREQGYSHGTSGSTPLSRWGGFHVECGGNETKLEECSADFHGEWCSHAGTITQCYNLLQIKPPSSLTISEGDIDHFCVSLEGTLRELVHVFIETRDENAIANYDYIPVSYTLTFGPSLQSEQCRDIEIINDSLAEGLEVFAVQLTTNSSAIELTTPQIMIYIQHNDAQSDTCEDDSITPVSGVDGSSLQLVEMCSEGVWSPVCDHNWTVADATVACRELGMAQDEVVAEVLPSGLPQEVRSIDCKGNEATLSDCFVHDEEATTCHYVLVECGAVSSSEAGSSSAGAVVGAVLTVLVVVVLVGVGVVVAVLSVIRWKGKTKSYDNSASTTDPNHYEFEEGYVRPVGGQQHPSLQPPAERREDDFELVNPVYGITTDADQPVPPATVRTPEHNLVNPLYAQAAQPSSQGRAEPVTGEDYETFETPHNPSGGGINGVNNPYENEEGRRHT